MALAPSMASVVLYFTGMAAMGTVISARRMIWNLIDPVDPTNRDRRIDSFTDTDCWRHLRFRKRDLPELLRLVDLPAYINCGTDERPLMVSGEYAFLLFLYRIHYPSTLALLQQPFGREYSQLSRIYTATVKWLDARHRHKVVGNIYWYRQRFDQYNASINTALARSPANPFPGTVPVYLNNLFGFIDGTARYICRPWRNNNAQFPMYNGYFHAHCMIFLGVSFPDGMVVLEPPFPGYFTDVMAWRDCHVRHQLDILAEDRADNNLPNLKLYGDKIFTTCALITAAFSLRFGPLTPWMTTMNRMMSPIRVSIEWCYGKIIARHKHADYRQKIQESAVAKQYYLAALFANAHTCLYGCQSTTFFSMAPPTVQQYFSQ